MSQNQQNGLYLLLFEKSNGGLPVHAYGKFDYRGIIEESQSPAGFLFSNRIAASLLILRDCDKHLEKQGGGTLIGAKMKRRSRLSVALYGNVSLERGYCNECGGTSFIKQGRFVCCGELVGETPKKFERMSEPFFGRKTPTKSEKDRILREQEDRCFYCSVLFGSFRYRDGIPFVIKIHWDHRMPFAYSQNNKTANFVAACHVCNGIKSSHLFQTEGEAQVYLADKRKVKGYDF